MKKLFLALATLFSFIQTAPVFAFLTEAVGPARSLQYGIREKKPYCFKQENGKYAGLDLAIFDLLSLESGLAPANFDSASASWEENLSSLKKGTIDVIGNATKTKERESWGTFSEVYRTEKHVLVTPRKKSSSFDAPGLVAHLESKRKTIESDQKSSHNATSLKKDLMVTAFIDEVKAASKKTGRIKIGIVKGVAYNSGKLMRFIEDQKLPAEIAFVKNNSYEDLLSSLMKGSVDMIVMEDVNARYLLNEQKQSHHYTVTDLYAVADQHFLFSQATIKPEFVKLFNKTILSAREKINTLIEEYTLENSASNLLFSGSDDVKILEKIQEPQEDDSQ